MENPVEILYSWQALLVAITASGLTQLIKTIFDVALGRQVVKRMSMVPPPADSDSKATVPVTTTTAGKEARKSNPWVNRILLPMIPILLGALIGALIPLRPEALTDYVDAKVPEWYWQDVIYGTWGAACGQFADYIFTKAKSILKAFIESKSAS